MYVCIRLESIYHEYVLYLRAELPPEAGNWAKITVLNVKNNKLSNIGSLPQSWPLLERLYLGQGYFRCHHIITVTALFSHV